MVKKEGEDGWRREEGLEIRWAARAESGNELRKWFKNFQQFCGTKYNS